MINVQKVKGRMVELGFIQADIAKALGVAVPTACQKLNGNRPIDLEEAKVLIRILKLNDEDVKAYFFCD